MNRFIHIRGSLFEKRVECFFWVEVSFGVLKNLKLIAHMVGKRCKQSSRADPRLLWASALDDTVVLGADSLAGADGGLDYSGFQEIPINRGWGGHCDRCRHD